MENKEKLQESEAKITSFMEHYLQNGNILSKGDAFENIERMHTEEYADPELTQLVEGIYDIRDVLIRLLGVLTDK